MHQQINLHAAIIGPFKFHDDKENLEYLIYAKVHIFTWKIKEKNMCQMSWF